MFALSGPFPPDRPAVRAETAGSLTLEFRIDNAAEAWRGLRQILEAFPDVRDRELLRYEMAQVFFSRGAYYEAADILAELAKDGQLEPYLRSSVFLRLGECYFNAGLYEMAFSTLQRARDAGIGLLGADALYGMALASIGLKEPARALGIWEELMQAAPIVRELQEYAFGQGLVFFKNGRLLEARSFFDKYPGDPRNLFFSALVRRSQGDTSGALTAFQDITKTFDRTEWAERARFEVGETYYQAGDFTLALKSFQSWLESYPRRALWPDTVFRVACAEFLNKRYEQVIMLLEPFLSDYPEHRLIPAAAHILSEAYVQVDRLDRVLDLYARRGPPEKRTPEENYGMVWAMVGRGDYLKAIELAEICLKLFYDPELTPKLLLVEGYAYQKLGRLAEAAGGYQLVVDRFPASELAARALLLMALAYHEAGDDKSVVTLVNRQWRSLPPQARASARETEFWIAEAAMNLKNYREARLGYEQFTGQGLEHPLSPYAFFGLATAQAESGEFPQARSTLKTFEQLAAEKKKPELGLLATLQLAHLYFNSKSYDQAVATYREFRGRDPKSPKVPEVLFQEATALRRGEYYSEAAKTWRMLAGEHPRHGLASEALFQAGKTEFDLGRYAEAVQDFRRVVERTKDAEPLNAEARLQIGASFYNAGDYVSAVEAYQDFLKRYPTDDRVPSVESYIQTAYFRMKKTPEEIEKLTVGQAKSGVLADLYWESGAKAYNAKDYPKAIEYFGKILLDFPSAPVAPRAFFYRAESLALVGRTEEAARAYKTFLESFPQDEQASLAMFRHAVTLFDLRQFPEAAEAFSRFARFYPDDPTARNAAFNVPLCYLKANLWDKAIQAYEELQAQFPDASAQSTAWHQIGLIQQKLGQDEKAAGSFARVRPEAAEYPEALYSMGLSYEKLGDVAGELRTYEAIRAVEPANNSYRISGLARLAELREAVGDKEAALELYRQVAQHAQDPAVQTLAQRKVQELGGQ